MGKITLSDKIIRFIVSYCFLPILIILTPFARLYSICTLTNFLDQFKSTNYEKQNNNSTTKTKDKHNQKVQNIIQQLLVWNKNGRKGQLCTGRKTWKTFTIHSMPKSTNNFTQINMSELNDIIEIDSNQKVLTVEPGMMMGRLTSILLPLGYTIPVVPELDTLSIGGLICGAGLETSSHKFGLFSDCCISYEIVLSTGEIINCSKDENSDLFYAIPMSYGTIGFLTAIKIPLVQAFKYVKVEYFPIRSDKEAIQLLEKVSGNNSNSNGKEDGEGKGETYLDDFVEAITYGPDNWVLMIGKMVNQADYNKVNPINRWYKPWFFKHVESIGKNGQKYTEYIKLRDYYHRHTRGYFWEAVTPFPYGNNPIFRFFLGWVFPLNFQIVKLLIPQFVLDIYYVRNHVVQDFVIPLRHLQKSLTFLHKLVQVYPIWICPCKGIKKKGMSGLGLNEMFIDIGVYGDTPKIDEYDPVQTTKKMESFTIQHNGTQALYADSYMTRDEFNTMFDTSHYYKVREQLNLGEVFPDVYNKISHVSRQIKS